MADIIPAIMPKSLEDVEEKVALVIGVADVVQLDVMDGKFVRPKSWPYAKQDMYFESIVSQERGLPHWDAIDYEIDLMVAHPLQEAQRWIQAGAYRVIAHIESFKGADDPELLEFLSLKNDFVEVGLAIGIGTSIDTIKPHLAALSCVQCMGIKRIGYQGEAFDEGVLAVIRDIRALAPELPISVDGAVSTETIGSLIKAGATRFVSGSGVYGEVSAYEAVRDLKKAAYEARDIV